MGLVVLNKDYLALGDYDIQGILGYQYFYRFAIKIDYKNRIMTVTDPAFFKPDPETPAFDINLSSIKPVLKAKAGFDPAALQSSNLLVDTGASYTISLLSDSSPAFSEKKFNGQLINIGKGLSGAVKGKYIQSNSN